MLLASAGLGLGNDSLIEAEGDGIPWGCRSLYDKDISFIRKMTTLAQRAVLTFSRILMPCRSSASLKSGCRVDA